MTRGLVYLLRLRVGEAIRANPLSPLALALLVATALGLARPRRAEVAALGG